MPSTADRVRLSKADRALCAEIIRNGSKSFSLASRLLPGRVRLPAVALYAYCRYADDAVDEVPAGAPQAEAVARLHDRLDRIYRGDGLDTPVEQAFAAVVAAYRIPKAAPMALIEGFIWDVAGRRYETIDELMDYAARVAGAVGVMMALLMGRRAPAVLARAADLGLAMQLTNIARDVGEDAAMGRIYLPLAWMREAGLDPDAWLADPKFTPALGRVVDRLLSTADRYYARGLTGAAALPGRCRPAIRLAGAVYRDIGREVRTAGHDSVSRRASTSKARKLALAGLVTATPFAVTPMSVAPPDPAVRFLTSAVGEDPTRPEVKTLDEKIGRMLELLAAPEARRRGMSLADGGSA